MFGFGQKKKNNDDAISRTVRAAMKLLRLGSAQWTDRDAKEFAREGYQYNAIVYSCIRIITKAVVSLEIQARRQDRLTGELLPFDRTDPVQRLLMRPNPMMDLQTLITVMAGFYLMTGTAYLERVPRGNNDDPNSVKGILELWPWPSYQMRPIVAKHDLADEDIPYSKMPLGYAYMTQNQSRMKAWEVDQRTGACNLLVWKTWNPFNPYVGLSPLEAAAMATDTHNDSTAWNKSMLQNSGQPSGVMTNANVLDDDEYRTVTERMKDHKGTINARDTMILEGGFNWHQLGLSPVDMDWLNGKKDAAATIATVYQVPSQMVNIEGAQTFANFEQARLSLYEDNAIPLAKELLAMLTAWLRPVYGDDLVLLIDENKIGALQSKRIAMFQAVNANQSITDNEARQFLGLPEWKPENVKGNPANDLWKASGMLPLSSDPLAEPSQQELSAELDAVDDELDADS